MANELKYIGLDTDTGLTVTAQIYGEDGVQVGAAISATEVGSTGVYTADMPVVGAATYAVRFFNGTTVIGVGSIEWDGTAEVTERDITAAIEALNDFDPATDAVANVTLVDTTTTNTDMRGTDGANTTAPDNAGIAAILVDTDALAIAAAAGQFDTADVSGLASQASVDTVDANVDAILVDTNELQTNQGNFATATGFATPGDVTTAVSGLATQASVDTIDGVVDAILVDTDTTIPAAIAALNDPTAADIADAVWDEAIADHQTAGSTGEQLTNGAGTGPTASQIADAVWDEAIADHQTAGSTGEALGNAGSDLTPVLTAIGNLNDFDPANDAVANVTLVDTTTTNTDMRGTDGANTVAPDNAGIAAILVDTDALAIAAAAGQFDTADVSGLATQASVDVIDGVVDAILVDTDDLQTNQGNFATATGFATPGDVTTAVSGLATQASVDVIDGVVDAILVDTDATIPSAISALNDISAADVYTEFTSGANEDAFKADVSGLASQASVDVIDGIVDSVLVDTGTSIPTLIGNLNDPSTADIADAVWDEAIADHQTAGSTGEQLTNGAGTGPTAADIADAVWDEAIADHQTAGSTGEALGNVSVDLTPVTSAIAVVDANVDQLLVDMAVVDANVDAILIDTNELQVNQPNFATATGFATPANITAATAGLATQSSVDVIDGIVDLILADTSEIQVNQPNFVTATGFATPADVTAATSNLATQASVDVVDANVDLILADTDELQTNQGNFATATGFATAADLTLTETTILAAIGATSSGSGGTTTAITVEIDNSDVIVDIEPVDYTLNVAANS